MFDQQWIRARYHYYRLVFLKIYSFEIIHGRGLLTHTHLDDIETFPRVFGLNICRKARSPNLPLTKGPSKMLSELPLWVKDVRFACSSTLTYTMALCE